MNTSPIDFPIARADVLSSCARPFALACACAAALSLLPAQALPVQTAAADLPLSVPLSRSIPVFASSGSASDAVAADLSRSWRSQGVPATLVFDLAKPEAAGVQRVLVSWFNDATYGYDHARIGQVGYNNLGRYRIEVHADEGGSSPPGQGAAGSWIERVEVHGNTLHSREHLVDVAGFRWLRIRVEEVDGSPGNADAGAHVDVYDASAAAGGWLFVGDSITANSLGHAPAGGASAFAQELERLTGVSPPQENAGMPGWKAEDVLRALPAWLDDFPGRYVPVSIGTNDAVSNVSPSQFEARLVEISRLILSKGKVPILPTIFWSSEPGHAARIPALNEAIARLRKRDPRILGGPDLHAIFSAHPECLSPDGIHPSDAGIAWIRKAWAQWASTNLPASLH